MTGIYFQDSNSYGMYREMSQKEVDRLVRKPAVWGPYSIVPREAGRYVHTVYPSAEAIIQDKDGDLRWANEEELDRIARRSSLALEQSFRQTRQP